MMIYEDPITMSKKEGAATVVGDARIVSREVGGVLVAARVYFEGDEPDSIVERRFFLRSDELAELGLDEGSRENDLQDAKDGLEAVVLLRGPKPKNRRIQQ